MTPIMQRAHKAARGENTMTEFTELLGRVTQHGEAWTVDVSDDWLQGRTLYGGLSAALCLAGAQRSFSDLPPLRSAQFAFVGPASGQLQIRPALLRKGKSTLFCGVDVVGEAGLATRATFCFGAARPSAFAHTALASPPAKAPGDCPDFFRNAPPALRFLEHIEGRLVGGALPFSGSTDPRMTLWLRHREPLIPSMVSLLALADAPPPAASAMSDKPAIISTMTWSIDMLTDTIATTDGWFLAHNAAERIGDGYSSQAMTVWDAKGAPVMASRQNVAVFA
jgi:acyl-CoA thioesterase